MQSGKAGEVISFRQPQFGLATTSRWSVMTGPFLFEAKGIVPCRAVDAKHAVEVVDLVLEELGKRTNRIDPAPLSTELLIDDFYLVGSLNPHHESGDREAIVPDPKILVSNVGHSRVDHEPGLVDLQVDDPHRRPDLRCRQPSTHSVLQPQVSKCLLKVVSYQAHRR